MGNYISNPFGSNDEVQDSHLLASSKDAIEVKINGKVYRGKTVSLKDGVVHVDGKKKENYGNCKCNHVYKVEVNGVKVDKIETTGKIVVHSQSCGNVYTTAKVTVGGNCGNISTTGAVSVNGSSGRISTLGRVTVGSLSRNNK